MLFELFAILASIALASLIAGFVVVFVATYKFQSREVKSYCCLHNFLADGVYIFITVLIVAVVVTPAMFIIKPFLDIYALIKRIYNNGFSSLTESDEVYLSQLQARFDAFFNPEQEEFFDCIGTHPVTTPEPVAIQQITPEPVAIQQITPEPVAIQQITPEPVNVSSRTWYVRSFDDGYGSDPYGVREFASAFGVSIRQVNSW